MNLEEETVCDNILKFKESIKKNKKKIIFLNKLNNEKKEIINKKLKKNVN